MKPTVRNLTTTLKLLRLVVANHQARTPPQPMRPARPRTLDEGHVDPARVREAELLGEYNKHNG